jgi:hypothetical protein
VEKAIDAAFHKQSSIHGMDLAKLKEVVKSLIEQGGKTVT